MKNLDINKAMYKSWACMKQRCINEKNQDYEMYGGRGITVSDRWLEWKNFEADMEDTWKTGLSLGRIDNEKGYSKENCEWQTPEQQANNRTSNRFIEYLGERRTLSEWCKILGLNPSRTRTRFYSLKWNIDRCFTILEPIKPTGRKYT